MMQHARMLLILPLLAAGRLLAADAPGAAGDETAASPRAGVTAAERFGAPVLRLRTTGLHRLGEALRVFLTRVASGEATDPAERAGGLMNPLRMYDHGHDPAAHGTEGQEAHHPDMAPVNRLTMLVAMSLKIPPRRMGHFLAPRRSPLLLAFAADPQTGRRAVGAYLPVRNFDELLAAWREDEVVRHLVGLRRDGLVRMDYPRYGPFYMKPVEGGGLAFGWSPALVEHLAQTADELWEEGELTGPHLRIALSGALLKEAARGSKDAGKTLPGLPPFVPPHLQALMRLPRALVADGLLNGERVETVTADLFLNEAVLAVDAVLRLADPPAPEGGKRQDRPAPDTPAPVTEPVADGGDAAEPEGAPDPGPADDRPGLLEQMPARTVAFASLPDAAALDAALRPVLHEAIPAAGRGAGGLLELILRETFATVRGEACMAYVRGDLHEMNALLVFRSRSRDAARAYVAAVSPHLPSLTSAAAVEGTVAVGFGLRHADLVRDWAEGAGNGPTPLGDRLAALEWSGGVAGEGSALFRGGVYPVDFVKAVFGEATVQARIMGMPMATKGRFTDRFSGIADSPRPALLTIVRHDARRLRVAAAIPAGAYIDVSHLLQTAIFGWQEIHGQLTEAWLEKTLDRAARAILREDLDLPVLQPEAPDEAAKRGAPNGEEWETDKPKKRLTPDGDAAH